ncbi:MAG: DUF3108 domain-containing protein [Thermodesulfobacteriota bacterium]
MRVKIILFVIFFLLWESIANADVQERTPAIGSEKSFLYTVKKFGIPILRAIIKIENGSSEQGKPFYLIQAQVDSSNYLGLFLRMKNRFTSTIDGHTCSPVRYVKEIDQEGFMIENKNYLQTLTFDYPNKRVVEERKGRSERREISLPPDTYDPLSMFGRYYLKEELHPDQDIRMSIYDGVKLRQMVFHSKKGRVKSKIFGEVEAICLESKTPFSTFGEKEGIIRIWYTTDGKRTPVSLELDLPIGIVRFELEEVKDG